LGAVAGPVIGSVIQGDSAQQASQAQQQGTDAATAEARRQFDLSRADLTRQNAQNRSDLSPYRAAGSAGINRLSQLMGIGGGASSVDRSQFERPIDRGAAPAREQFMRAGAVGPGPGQVYRNAQGYIDDPASVPGGTWGPMDQSQGAPQGGGFDEAGYNAALDKWNAGGTQFDQAGYDAAVAQAGQTGPGTPGFGDLTKKFTLADFWDDPVTKASYQSGLDQGTKSLTNMAGARGNLNSGAQLKALTRFGTDYTGNQAAGSQARFVGDQTNLYNRLSGIAGTGQTATNSTVNSGANTAGTIANLGAQTSNTIGGLLSAQGNARGAAAIAGGNALSGGLSNASNYYGQQQTLDKLLNRSGGGYTGGTSYPMVSGMPGQFDLNNLQYG